MKTVDRMMKKYGWKKRRAFTPEEVRACREGLEHATRASFEQSRIARQRAWSHALYVILD